MRRCHQRIIGISCNDNSNTTHQVRQVTCVARSMTSTWKMLSHSLRSCLAERIALDGLQIQGHPLIIINLCTFFLLLYVDFSCFQENVRLKQKRSRCYNPFSRLLHTPCTHHTMTSSWPPPITGNIIEPAPQAFTEAGNVSWFFPPQGAPH